MSTAPTGSAGTGVLARSKGSPIAYALLALVALLIGNVLVTPSFLSVRLQDGHPR